VAQNAQDFFAGLPAPLFFESNTAQIAQTIILGFEAGFQAASGKPLTLGAADPWRYACLYLADLVSQAFAAGNWVAGQNTLREAVGDNLDVLGSFWGDMGKRLPAASALTTLSFSISAPADADIPIPTGTVVSTASGSTTVTFATTADAVISAGSFSVAAPAECSVSGGIGNGFLPGQISQLQNWDSPFVINAVNTTTSSGGADKEADDRYRYRLVLLPKALSTCGTQAGYEFFSLSTNQTIAQVEVYSNPGISGTVQIYPLMDNGVLPTTDILTAIYNACSPTNNRPLSDLVQVLTPIARAYSVSLSYYVPKILAAAEVAIDTNVKTVVDNRIQSWLEQLGGVVDPSLLAAEVSATGAVGVVVTAPVWTVLLPWEQPVLTDDPVVLDNGLI
jgi:phage-related baseplate assembly protein